MSLNLGTRQRAMLKEMGVKVWWPTPAEPTARAPVTALAPVAPGTPFAPVASPKSASLTGKIVPISIANNAIEISRKSSLSSKITPQNVVTTSASPVVLQPLDAAQVAAMDWPALQAAVANCQACALCQTRKKAVFGGGRAQAIDAPNAPDLAPTAPSVDWLIVGDSPDAAEDAAGEPFIGPAGQLLDNMLKALGTSRAHGAFITNITKCHPPNRNPETAEIAQCAPYLQRQIALLQPKVIIAMGRFAVQNLLAGSVPDVASIPLGKLRGQTYRYQGVPVVVSYHPTYLLRALADKGKAWEDLCLAAGLAR